MFELPLLHEYEWIDVGLSDAAARSIAATGFLNVAPAADLGRWRITAKEFVGSVVVDGMRLLVRPKIKPDNLFLLLEVGLPPSAWRRESIDYAQHADLLPSVIAFFTRTVETTLARGVLRAYQEQNETLVSLRGRIDFPTQINRGGVKFPIACRYEDYTPDNAENRFLRAAVRLASRVPMVAAEDRRRLLQQLVALEDVADVPVQADDLDRITITRLNAHYAPALRLARLLLANLTLIDHRGATSASSFMVDMNQLFERFVTERLRRALQGRLEVRDQTRAHLAVGNKVLMRPDLEFRRRGEPVYVADIKYKLTADAAARNADYYQLLAYTTALDLPEGVLIYCLADSGVEHRSIIVRHAGKVLHVKPVDLTGSTGEVATAIEELADWIAERVTLSATNGSARASLLHPPNTLVFMADGN